MKFTFKTEKVTGLYSSFYPDTHHIKLNKKKVGLIEDKEPFKIRLQVMKTEKDLSSPNNNPNCPWKWIALKKQSASLAEAKAFLNEYITEILQMRTLYQQE